MPRSSCRLNQGRCLGGLPACASHPSHLSLHPASQLVNLQSSPAGFTDVDAFLRSIALVLRHRQLLAAQAVGSSSGEAADGSAFSDEEAEEEAGSDGATTAAAQLAHLAARAARAGVAAAASRGWPGVAALLLPSITADGRCGVWQDCLRAFAVLLLEVPCARKPIRLTQQA